MAQATEQTNMDAAARQRLYQLLFPEGIPDLSLDTDATLAERHLIEQLIEFLVHLLDSEDPDPDMEVDNDDCCEAFEDDLQKQVWGGETEDDEDNGDDEHQGEGVASVNTWTEDVKYIRRPDVPKPELTPPMSLRISRKLIERMSEQQGQEKDEEAKNG